MILFSVGVLGVLFLAIILTENAFGIAGKTALGNVPFFYRMPVLIHAEKTIELDKEFTLRKGEVGIIDGANVQFTLVDFVTFHCPRGALCGFQKDFPTIVYELTVDGTAYRSQNEFLNDAPYAVKFISSDYRTSAKFLLTEL